MQTYQWRIFFVVFELMEDKHLQYPFGESTLYQRVCSILNSILQNGENKNYSIKLFVINTVIPSLINKSLEILTPEISKEYMKLFVSISKIEWASKEEKTKQALNLLKIHSNILDCKGIELDEQAVTEFNELLKSMNTYYAEKGEQIKVVTFQIIQRYLKIFTEQLLSKCNSKDKTFYLV